MATLPQYNSALGAWNNAMLQEQYSGGAAGAGSSWSNYNDLLDRYGIGNGSTAGVGGGSYPSMGMGGGTGGGAGGTIIGGTGSGTAGGPVNFNLNPTPQGGSGTFGAVPGAIGAPPSIWQQTQAIPGMSDLTGQNTSLIGSQMNGNLSPSTVGNLTDSAAARGVALGQGGGTGLTNEILLKTLGLTHEQLQQQGQQNYLSFLGASGQQQQSPQLLTDIASRNATMAAAPNPTLASQYLMGLSRGSSTGLRNPLAMLGGYGTGNANLSSGGGYGGYGDLIGGFNPLSPTSIGGGIPYNNNTYSGFDDGFGGQDDFSSQPDQINYGDDPYSANAANGSWEDDYNQ